MAKKRARPDAAARRTWRWAGLMLFALGLYVLASVATYSHLINDLTRGPLTSFYTNAGGNLGRWAAGLLISWLGWLVVWSVPGGLMAWGWNRMRLQPPYRLSLRTLGAVPLLLALATFAASIGGGVKWGGIAGQTTWDEVNAAVGPVGGALLVGVSVMGLLWLELEVWSPGFGTATQRLSRIGSILGAWFLSVLKTLGLFLAAGLKKVFAPRDPGSHPEHHAVSDGSGVSRPIIVEADKAPSALPSARAVSPPPVNGTNGTTVSKAEVPAALPATAASGPTQEEAVVVRRVAPGLTGENDLGNVPDRARDQIPKKGKSVPRALFSAMTGKFTLPTTDLFDLAPEQSTAVLEDELVENSRILTSTLKDFGIDGRVGEVHPGPVITRYELTPGPGVRVSQIVNRAEDLALKLRAIRIRIVAPIPGKAAVGIEVPNSKPQVIYIRKLLESPKFVDADGPLTLALGRDINGYPVMAELTRMPHLLVAGTTGSGKSVCVNSIISSLLMKHGPDRLRMLMIDPKMLELPMYNGIPHLLTDVVTDPKLAARALKWLIVEMERRYQVLAVRGSRNIQSYNEKIRKEGVLHEGEEELPFIVALIDELADLMITSGKEVEEPIARLAQMARAVGIHLIVATQRPSVDVLTGVIKANFPTRIAFQVASRTDSRTILDQNGAETLLGRGDMLFLPPGQATSERVHGAFVSESETQSLVKFLKDQGQPKSDLGLEDALTETETPAGDFGFDDRFEEAARVVVTAGQGSASLLQRRLKVGYARAGRLVDMLEAAGIVSPSEGSKPREVLVDDVRLEQLLREQDES